MNAPGHNFSPASDLDAVVHGAERPGFGRPGPAGMHEVHEWVAFMRGRGIKRVLCLQAEEEIGHLFRVPVLDVYRRAFEKVAHVAMPDGCAPPAPELHRALDLLRAADSAGAPVVVHCNAGQGRTGIVLAAWLRCRHALSGDEAIRTVVATAQREAALRLPAAAPGARELIESLSRWAATG
jgi:atypical dual specificity phosphatase